MEIGRGLCQGKCSVSSPLLTNGEGQGLCGPTQFSSSLGTWGLLSQGWAKHPIVSTGVAHSGAHCSVGEAGTLGTLWAPCEIHVPPTCSVMPDVHQLLAWLDRMLTA